MLSNMLPKSNRSPFSKLRPGQPPEQPTDPPTYDVDNPPPWSRDEYVDLWSRDKVKVKAAVRRFMDDQVRNDWAFTWPPERTRPLGDVLDDDTIDAPGSLQSAGVQDEMKDEDGYQAEDPEDLDEDEDADLAHITDKHSVYDVVEEDESKFVPRVDWDSDDPPDEGFSERSLTSDGSNTDTEASRRKREAQRRRAIREEMEWNEGLACFEQRRNAWTEAKTIKMRKKPEPPQTPTAQHAEKRRSFFRGSRRSHSSASSPAVSNSGALSDVLPNQNTEKTSNSGTASAQSESSVFTIVTVVPRQDRFLPPDNPLRASISSDKYLQIYDKVVSNSLQPSCPINLADMLGACVSGWLRDGELSPRPALPIDPTFRPINGASKKKKRNSWASPSTGTKTSNSGRKLSITSLLSRNKDPESRPSKGVRQSLSQAFGFGGPLSQHGAAAGC